MPTHNIKKIILLVYAKTYAQAVINGNLVSWDLRLDELIGDNQPALTGVPSMPAQLTNKFDWAEKIGFEQDLQRYIGEFPGTAQMIYPKYPLTKNTNKPLF